MTSKKNSRPLYVLSSSSLDKTFFESGHEQPRVSFRATSHQEEKLQQAFMRGYHIAPVIHDVLLVDSIDNQTSAKDLAVLVHFGSPMILDGKVITPRVLAETIAQKSTAREEISSYAKVYTRCAYAFEDYLNPRRHTTNEDKIIAVRSGEMEKLKHYLQSFYSQFDVKIFQAKAKH